MDSNSEFTLIENGVCIKSEDLTVEYQNLACKRICGDQFGKICSKGCVLLVRNDSRTSESPREFRFFKNMKVDDNLTDCLVLFDKQKVISLISNLEPAVTELTLKTAKYGATPFELKILRLYLEGKCQNYISESLFISISTLKSHMNNIFKKVPEDLKIELKRWHTERKY